ncbi:MAG: ABC transporter ATP-binding protein [Prevotella sp.]|nr:ABC transporter ATP-binding protein [Prevotella sp.]
MILTLDDIKLSFTNTHSEVLNLLNGVNLHVKRGKITALVGGNGTGKTTLFNIISGFQGDYTGKVWFEGRDISHTTSYKIARKGIGRLFQGCQLMGDLTLMENMKVASSDTTGEFPFSSLFHPKRVKEQEYQKEQQAIEILKRLFGEDCKYLQMLNHKASSFSHGEQRLIAIARILMNTNTKLLLLDEPTAGVNPVYIDTIKGIIREMVAEGLTVLLIEHNMHFVRSIADICAYLDDGIIAKVGPTVDVLDDKEVRNSYLGL